MWFALGKCHDSLYTEKTLISDFVSASSPSRIGFFRCGFSYFRPHFPAPYPVSVHFPDDFRRGAWLVRDFPAFPPVCRHLSPAVLRPSSRRRCGILWAHHGYTWWLRYGKTKKSMCRVQGYGNPYARRPRTKKGSQTYPSKTGGIGFSKSESIRASPANKAIRPLSNPR